MKSRFFTVAEQAGRWWFMTPGGNPMFSIGLNHIDSAPLRYPEQESLWSDRYGNSQERWLRDRVTADLRAWGFNTVGWTQEVVVLGSAESPVDRHSRNFTFEEYQWLGLYYCHMLPFAEIHQWDAQTPYPDVFASVFEEWCDYVARSECGRMADDPKLIGYFFSDCPTWAHISLHYPTKKPWFDPDTLQTPSGRQELARTAEKYYRTIAEAIRRYDPNHLILGDRYEGKALVPEEVLQAAAPHVDVLSFQHFSDAQTIRRDFNRWHAQTGKPVLLADACVPNPADAGAPRQYASMMRALRETTCCVGWHYCGAYLKNRSRRRGLRDESDKIDEPMVSAMTEVNHEIHRWVKGF